MLLADTVLVLLALQLAYLARFEGRIPEGYRPGYWVAAASLAVFCALGSLATGLHCWAFLTAGAWEALRLALTRLGASFAFVVLLAAVDGPPVPSSVIVLEFFLFLALTGALRFGPRLFISWRMDRRRDREQKVPRVLVVGAGTTGEILVRSLNRSPHCPFHVVGLVDDAPHKRHTSVGGKRVLGTLDELPRLVRTHAVDKVLIAIRCLEPDRIRAMLRLCAELKVGFKTLATPQELLDRPFSAAMLKELGVEQLMTREAVKLDESRIRALAQGRTILVTGAGGSIGSEITRQLAACEPARLVLVDINENELYLLTRELEERRLRVRVVAAVADIRDADRLLRLGREHRPHYVFHAAAHKHVPLMEDAPDEAVKNNVTGSLNVARMADACAAERFVLVSTDKAVFPTSIMGATKRVAECTVRDLLRHSRTAFTAVRFGNVLGSAGSVTHLFQRQIARGGPVTVTHPDCKRYFMTLSEAVSLLLVAGLSDYGELCVLDMGTPVLIAELAAAMIVMAGHVPQKEIAIEFTGLRPGEKLSERLLTEEEEQTREVRGKIIVVRSPPPPPNLRELLLRLQRAAEEGDPDEVRVALKALVPSYTRVPAQPLPRAEVDEPAETPERDDPAPRAPVSLDGI